MILAFHSWKSPNKKAPFAGMTMLCGSVVDYLDGVEQVATFVLGVAVQ